MNTGNDVNAIRNLARIALPEDDGYLYRLGVALYSFASLSSFMAEIVGYLDPTVNVTELQAKTGGKILGAFTRAVSAAKAHIPALGPVGQVAIDLFTDLNLKRSDIVHAYPITNANNKQILHRRLDVDGKYFEVTNDFLNSFISGIHDVSDQLYDIRKIVRPGLGD